MVGHLVCLSVSFGSAQDSWLWSDEGNIYAFNASLPDVSRPVDAGGYALKEWDADCVSDGEVATRRGADNGLDDKDDALADGSRISTLDELEEFQNTDLDFLFHVTSVSDARQPKPPIASGADSSAREHLSRSNAVENPIHPSVHSSRSHSPRHTAPPPLSPTAEEGIENEGGPEISTRPPGEHDHAADVEGDEAGTTRVKHVSFEEHVSSAAELSVPPAGENPEASQPPQLRPLVPRQDDPSSSLHLQAPQEQGSAPHIPNVQSTLDVSPLHNIIPQVRSLLIYACFDTLTSPSVSVFYLLPSSPRSISASTTLISFSQ